jgi:hypothetical protein
MVISCLSHRYGGVRIVSEPKGKKYLVRLGAEARAARISQ